MWKITIVYICVMEFIYVKEKRVVVVVVVAVVVGGGSSCSSSGVNCCKLIFRGKI